MASGSAGILNLNRIRLSGLLAWPPFFQLSLAVSTVLVP